MRVQQCSLDLPAAPLTLQAGSSLPSSTCLCRYIVDFTGVGSTRDASPDDMRRSLYLVQEYMPGGTLKVRCSVV